MDPCRSSSVHRDHLWLAACRPLDLLRIERARRQSRRGESAKSGACGRRDRFPPLPFLSGRGTDLRVWPGFPCIVAGTPRPSRRSRRDWRCPAPRAIACPRCTRLGILAAAEARGLGKRGERASPIRGLDRFCDDRSRRALRHRPGCRCSVHFVRACPLQQRATWLIGWRATAISGGVATFVLAVVFADMDTAAACFLRALVR